MIGLDFFYDRSIEGGADRAHVVQVQATIGDDGAGRAAERPGSLGNGIAGSVARGLAAPGADVADFTLPHKAGLGPIAQVRVIAGVGGPGAVGAAMAAAVERPVSSSTIAERASVIVSSLWVRQLVPMPRLYYCAVIMPDTAVPSWFASEWRRCGVRCSRWAGLNELGPGAEARRRRMQQFTLYLFIAGQATLRHGSESIRAMTGQTWLLPPGWTYRIRNPTTQCCRWLEIQLELLIDRSLSEHPPYRLRLPAGVENPANMEAVVADFTAVAQAATRTERDLLLRPQVDALIGHYLCSGFASGAVQTGDDRPSWLEEVLAAIAERPFAERTTIASIAAQVGIAVSTIQHWMIRPAKATTLGCFPAARGPATTPPGLRVAISTSS